MIRRLALSFALCLALALSPAAPIGAQKIGNSGASAIATLISTQTANNSAALQWTGLTGNEFMLRCSGLIPATGGAALYLQFGEGGGPTWQTANYRWETTQQTSGAGNNAIVSAADSGIAFNTSLTLTESGTFDLFGNIYHAQSTAAATEVQFATNGSSNGAANSASIYGHGKLADTIAKTGIRVIPSAGNITSGSCSLYQVNS